MKKTLNFCSKNTHILALISILLEMSLFGQQIIFCLNSPLTFLYGPKYFRMRNFSKKIFGPMGPTWGT